MIALLQPADFALSFAAAELLVIVLLSVVLLAIYRQVKRAADAVERLAERDAALQREDA